MKKLILIISIFTTTLSITFGQHVGIGTEDPQAMLDINGDMILRTFDITIVDSVTYGLDVNTDKFSRYRLWADLPYSQFVIGGMTAGMDGRFVTLYNRNTYIAMVLTNEDPLATSGDAIITGTNSDLAIAGGGLVSLEYDTSVQRWIVYSTSKVPGETIWDTSGANIFFENFVGIGTQEPTAPLSIETALDAVGFSHMAMSGADSIKLESSISNIGGAIGTTSDDIFSLNAGGTGKVHIWPDGKVVIGDDADPSDFAGTQPHSRMTSFDSKLTILTPINSSGWEHIGGADSIIISEGVGGVSGAIGTVTNHIFRLNSGGQGKLHIYPNGNVLVGTSSDGPFSKLTVRTPNNTDGISHVSDGGVILKTFVGGVSAVLGTASNHTMRISANNVAVINIEPNGTVGIGTTNPAGYKLAVNGSIRAKELVVETGWADYVFNTEYKLRPLKDIEDFIALHHHLPNIPSAKDIQDNGLHVGEVQKKMMEKIEELTLYIIALNKEVEILKNIIDHGQ